MAMKQITQYLGTGRRKKAIARVFLRPGSGAIKINGRELEHYFPTDAARFPVRQPFTATETAEKFDAVILANGGGFIGQAGAIRVVDGDVGDHLGAAQRVVEADLAVRADRAAPIGRPL